MNFIEDHMKLKMTQLLKYHIRSTIYAICLFYQIQMLCVRLIFEARIIGNMDFNEDHMKLKILIFLGRIIGNMGFNQDHIKLRKQNS